MTKFQNITETSGQRGHKTQIDQELRKHVADFNKKTTYIPSKIELEKVTSLPLNYNVSKILATINKAVSA